jgi:hypothetical protein
LIDRSTRAYASAFFVYAYATYAIHSIPVSDIKSSPLLDMIALLTIKSAHPTLNLRAEFLWSVDPPSHVKKCFLPLRKRMKFSLSLQSS